MNIRLCVTSITSLALLALTGCGPTYLKPVLPNDFALAPAVIYMPPCVSEKATAWDSVANKELAVGYAVCQSVHSALEARLAAKSDRYVLRQSQSAGKNYADITPDQAAEASLQAKYRIILDRPGTNRVEIGTPPFTSVQQLVANMNMTIVDVTTNTTLGRASLSSGLGVGAGAFVDRLISGLEGPRCSPVNVTSFEGITAHPGATCPTFAIYPK